MDVFANGHTSSNTPDPIRTRKLGGERPGQYWGGGPPGKPLGCCWLFVVLFSNEILNMKNFQIFQNQGKVQITINTVAILAQGNHWVMRSRNLLFGNRSNPLFSFEIFSAARIEMDRKPETTKHRRMPWLIVAV